jgi:hypothetical protein
MSAAAGGGAAARREEGTISSLEGGEAPEFIDAGDRVVALVYQRGRIRGSADPIEQQIGYVWTVRNGKGVRGQVYFSWEEPLADGARSAPPSFGKIEDPSRCRDLSAPEGNRACSTTIWAADCN